MVRNSFNLSPKPLKFMCSYGGRILPRYPDGILRYHGGETRVLSVDRFISFSDLLVKLGEMCGTPVSLRCQLPTEDLDALVSITCDEDLTNLIEEYDRAAAVAAPPSPSPLKIRAFLSSPKTTKKVSPPSSTASNSSDATSPRSPFYSAAIPPRCPSSTIRQVSRPRTYPVFNGKTQSPCHQYAYRNDGHVYLIHNGNHWQ
ncbi:hypothetical protein ACJIZ3_005185 [Penstemon smallii]|uniref:PB1 domain-containing protein n=1 Tax=Penstemon smallii TaxID=265156 RepID=A0ABD3S4F0_9LAMI